MASHYLCLYVYIKIWYTGFYIHYLHVYHSCITEMMFVNSHKHLFNWNTHNSSFFLISDKSQTWQLKLIHTILFLLSITVLIDDFSKAVKMKIKQKWKELPKKQTNFNKTYFFVHSSQISCYLTTKPQIVNGKVNQRNWLVYVYE